MSREHVDQQERSQYLQNDNGVKSGTLEEAVDWCAVDRQFSEDREVSRPKNAAVKDIDIDIADILGQKYLYRPW